MPALMMSAQPSAPPSPPATITVEVAYSPRAGEVEIVSLQLAVGATVHDALRASGLAGMHGMDEATMRVGVWCKPKEATTLLRERDRVEVYRALRVDPKEARRLRYKRHLENARAKGRPPSPDEAAG